MCLLRVGWYRIALYSIALFEDGRGIEDDQGSDRQALDI